MMASSHLKNQSLGNAQTAIPNAPQGDTLPPSLENTQISIQI